MDERIWLRNQRFLPQWSQSAEQKNGQLPQHALTSADPVEQTVLPFFGPTSQRPAIENFDYYHRRATGHHTSLGQHMKLDLLLRLRTETALHDSDTALASLLRHQIDNYDNTRGELPTVLKVER